MRSNCRIDHGFETFRLRDWVLHLRLQCQNRRGCPQARVRSPGTTRSPGRVARAGNDQLSRGAIERVGALTCAIAGGRQPVSSSKQAAGLPSASLIALLWRLRLPGQPEHNLKRSAPETGDVQRKCGRPLVLRCATNGQITAAHTKTTQKLNNQKSCHGAKLFVPSQGFQHCCLLSPAFRC